MRVAKVIGWLLLATFLLVALLYLILVAINWTDRPASAAALRFEQIVASRPAVSTDDNAAVYVWGFGAPTDADPEEVGARRMAWLETFDAGTRRDSDPLSKELSFQSGGSPVVAHLAEACGQESDRLQCASVFESLSRAWQPSDLDALVLRRYEALLTRRAWRDVVPMHVAAPWPGFSNISHAQRLYLLRLGQWAKQSRVDEVRQALEADFAFWRAAVPAADSLVAQMIAVSSLRQHFLYSNLILRGLSPEQATRSIPADWSREFATAERSMKRVMAGEMAFWKLVMADVKRQAVEGPVSPDSEGTTLLQKWTGYLTDPLFKMQDTMNGVAERRWRLCEEFEAPLSEYLRLKQSWEVTPAGGGFSVYNPVGKMVLQIDDGSTYLGYALRASSVEGMRRAAVLAAQLRTLGTAFDAVGGLIANSDLRDPYTEKPFDWNEERRTVTFTSPDIRRWRRNEFFY